MSVPTRLAEFVQGLTPRPSQWSCWVPGEPKATQTGTVHRFGRRLVPVRRHAGWIERIALAAHASRPEALLEGPLGVVLVFARRRPVRIPRGLPYPITRPDVGNLSKGLLDALQGIVYRDDAQIVELLERKRFAESAGPGVWIAVWPIQEQEFA